MRIEHKTYYYFEEQDTKMFEKYLKEHLMSKTEFATKCGLSVCRLSHIIHGRRAITQNTLDKFIELGLKVI